MLQKIVGAPKRIVGFYGDVTNELKRVTWPSKKEVYGTTVVVLVTVFFFGCYLFLVDLVLRHGIDLIRAFFR
jgi:preprotein translocase subunit SecE